MGLYLIILLAVLSVGLSAFALWQRERLNWRFKMPQAVTATGSPQFERIFDYMAPTGQAHSPAILLDHDEFYITWFEGSHEAQADVDIHAVRFTQTGAGWHAGAPGPIVTRRALGDVFEPEQLVVTLGNTVENENATGGMFATVVSVGGWAMASVADLRLGQGGLMWARKLSLSPFLNRSFLVKSPMVAMADDTYALPAYFEMGATYGAFVRLDSDGRVCDSRRMAGVGNKPIQPMVVPLSDTRAVAFLRDFDPSGRLLVSHTENGGKSWSVAHSTDIANPSAPVAALALGDGRILMAMNDDAAGADRLRLAISGDEGHNWQVISTLEQDDGDARYPMLRRLSGGDILLTYSHATKRGIRACLFNQAWVEAQ
ncbi:MAG: exo-alpha-sialidase [Roseovarius sp.]|nr:exo-alpha-sialidase [Roseovarius sp.]